MNNPNSTAAHADNSSDGKHGQHDHEHGTVLGFNIELVFAIASGVCVGVGWLLATLIEVHWGVPFGLYLAAYFFGGWFTTLEAIDKIRHGQFEIDFLMLVAAIGAATLGEWFEGGLLLFLFSIGHALENYAMGRARRAIEALADLAPDTARVRRDGKEVELPVEELVVSDVVVVRPDERLPADGYVVTGESGVDQSPVTGESIPVDKQR